MPGEPSARRTCIASCTLADPDNHLLVPPPPPPPPSTPHPFSAQPPAGPLALQSHRGDGALTHLISPADLLPWVSSPEQLFGHWLRLEAYAIAPQAHKVVDALVYMGPLDVAPPRPPLLSKIQVVDVRPTHGSHGSHQQHSQQQLQGEHWPGQSHGQGCAGGSPGSISPRSRRASEVGPQVLSPRMRRATDVEGVHGVPYRGLHGVPYGGLHGVPYGDGGMR